MSKDLKLAHLCPHDVVDEALTLEGGLWPLANMTSSSAISVRVDDIVVPVGGLQAPADFVSLAYEPFTVSGTRPRLSLSSDGLNYQEVVVTPGRYTVDGLRTLVGSLARVASFGGRPWLRSRTSGEGAVVAFGVPHITASIVSGGTPFGWVAGSSTTRDGATRTTYLDAVVAQPYTIGVGAFLTVNVDGTTTGFPLTAGLAVASQVADDVIAADVPRLSASIHTRADGGVVVRLEATADSAHEAFGLPEDRVYVGREVTPAWTLVRPSTLDEYRRAVVFPQGLGRTDAPVDASYRVIPDVCPRCSGTRQENDIRYDGLGDPEFTQEEALLVQDVKKLVLTVLGSNPFHVWYGTNIVSLVGSKATGSVEARVSAEIANAMQAWTTIKQRQSRIQAVTDGEVPYRLSRLSVVRDDVDPAILRIEMEIMSRRMRTIPVVLEVEE